MPENPRSRMSARTKADTHDISSQRGRPTGVRARRYPRATTAGLARSHTLASMLTASRLRGRKAAAPRAMARTRAKARATPPQTPHERPVSRETISRLVPTRHSSSAGYCPTAKSLTLEVTGVQSAAKKSQARTPRSRKNPTATHTAVSSTLYQVLRRFLLIHPKGPSVAEGGPIVWGAVVTASAPRSARGGCRCSRLRRRSSSWPSRRP